MSKTSENIQAGDVSGMGPVSLPNNGKVGSGDVPAGRKKKKKKKKMKTYEEFTNKEVSEGKGKFDEAIESVEVALLDTKSLDDVALVVSTALIKSYGSDSAKDILNLLRNMIS